MFTNHIPADDSLISVNYSGYAKRHFLKDFKSKYKGSQWISTEESIFLDLSRITFRSNKLQHSQQVDELYYRNGKWIFKYDFRVAKTNESPKTAGNRCVVSLCINTRRAEILLIYGKNNLPKNRGETQFIKSTIKNEFSKIADYFSIK